MSAPKFTPGPWTPGMGKFVCLDGDYPATVIHCNGKGIAMAWGVYHKNIEANAHLIAAAPDLYEAAIIQHECGLPYQTSWYDEECVAGWEWVHPDGRTWTASGSWDDAPPMHPIMEAALAKARGEA